MLGLDYNSTGLNVIIYLNQSSEQKMIDIPGCGERTNFNSNFLNYADLTTFLN